ALRALIGEHDFTSFCSTKSTKKSHVRNLYDIRLEQEPAGEGGSSGLICIYVTGSGFLQHMVRIIVGTLLQVGEGKRDASEFEAILQAKDRARAGPTAMPHGLMLWEVVY